jgi:single-strand DNA-binding protein
MPYMNQAIVMGHLGKDAETKNVGSSTVTTFSLATSKRWRDKQSGEWKEKTAWHNIVAWKLSEKNVAALSKGATVMVIGEIDNRSYEKDGQKRYVTEINANEVKVLSEGRKSEDDDSMPF